METPEEDMLFQFILAVFGGAIVPVCAMLARMVHRWFRYTRPLNRIWGFRTGEDSVCVVTGNITQVGSWRHLMASGDVRAYGEVISAVRRNYRRESIREFFAEDFDCEQYATSNIISVGGPWHNAVTQNILDRLEHPFTFDLKKKAVVDRRVSPPSFHEICANEKKVEKDYGVVIKARSPYDDERYVLVLMGYTTYGVLAAARCIADAQRYVFRNAKLKKKFINARYFSVMVEADLLRDSRGAEDIVPRIVEDSFLEFGDSEMGSREPRQTRVVGRSVAKCLTKCLRTLARYR